MARKKPGNLDELFNFYYEDFKPLYNRLHIKGEPPLEMLFEINAAFDHISRHWYYQEAEAVAVDQSCRHLKRGAFDAFKIILLDTMDKYNELLGVDTSIIDNGEFDRSLKKLVAGIENTANSGPHDSWLLWWLPAFCILFPASFNSPGPDFIVEAPFTIGRTSVIDPLTGLM